MSEVINQIAILTAKPGKLDEVSQIIPPNVDIFELTCLASYL